MFRYFVVVWYLIYIFGKRILTINFKMSLITKEKVYKYEVAFSFLENDEALAYQINDLIQDRLSTFIYTEQQKEIVGKDGVETYTKIFSEEARIVVVIYCEGWGKTFWTGIEENAIKLRSFEESPDFTIFISLDDTKPRWLSKTQIWYGFNRYGIKSVAAIIEKRIAEYGGQVREETIIDQAERHKREIKRLKDIEDYLLSNKALGECINEVKRLLQLAEKNINEITDHQLNFNFGHKKSPETYYICFGQDIGLGFMWKQAHINSLIHSYLQVWIADSDLFFDNPSSNARVIKEEYYIFYVNEANTKGWVRKKDNKEFKTTEQLIDYWQKDFLERVRKNRLKER